MLFLVLLVAYVCHVAPHQATTTNDWLITNITTPVTLVKSGDRISLTNGLITRQFTLSPAFGTVEYRSEIESRSIIRAINDEAKLTLDGVDYGVGGLRVVNSSTHAYLNRSNLAFSSDVDAFQFSNYTTSPPAALFHWVPGLRHSPFSSSWPPNGLKLSIYFVPPSSAKIDHSGITVTVHYEMYVGIPLLVKWVTLDYQNTSDRNAVLVNQVTVEYLATQKPYNQLDNSQHPLPTSHTDTGPTSSWLYVQSDEPHGSNCQWESDSRASVDYGADEQVLVCGYVTGASFWLGNSSGDGRIQRTVDSFRVMELVVDSDDRERIGLSRHRMARLLAPQTQENPIFFHGTDPTTQGFKIAVEQLAAVGFEMFIYSFGSGFYLENTDPDYIRMIADQVAFAREYGIEVGGYDLIDLDRGGLGPDWDCIDSSGKVTGDACFASGWDGVKSTEIRWDGVNYNSNVVKFEFLYDHISEIIFNFINETGISMLETDGPYGGQSCSATNHTHHKEFSDSIFQQNRLQMELYQRLKLRNIFINQPDYYFFQGGNKDGMGYNEDQYNLPRWEDLSISRQGMFDDTYHFLPTQGWMQVPLVQYHGGGEAAEFDPMSHYLLEYEWALAQYLSYGVAACYRGPRLYDSVQSMTVARKWVDFYKKYRDIVTSDIIHVRRPDMQDYDCILHVNPFITNRGLAVVFNPTTTALHFTLPLSLYYAGITNKAIVMQEGDNPVTLDLDRQFTISIDVVMEPKTITWYLIHSGD